MAFSIYNAAARLSRIRAENSAGRVVEGLGAANLTFTRARASTGYAATVGSDSVQLEGALAALARLDAKNAANDARQDAAIAKFRAGLERLSGNVRKLESAWASTSGNGYAPGSPLRRQSLAQRLNGNGFGIQRNGQIEIGPIQLGGPGLISLSPKFLRGSGGKIFGAAMLSRAISAGIQGVATAAEGIRDVAAKGGTRGEALKAGGLGVARGAIGTADAIFGITSAAAGVSSIITGNKQEDEKAKVDKFFDELFTTREEQARRRKAKEDALFNEYKAVNDAVAKQWTRIDATTPTSFRLSGRRELSTYRREMREVNSALITAKEQGAKERAARQAEAN